MCCEFFETVVDGNDIFTKARWPQNLPEKIPERPADNNPAGLRPQHVS